MPHAFTFLFMFFIWCSQTKEIPFVSDTYFPVHDKCGDYDIDHILYVEDVNSMVEEEAITSTTDDAKRKKKWHRRLMEKKQKKTYKKLTVMQ